MSRRFNEVLTEHLGMTDTQTVGRDLTLRWSVAAALLPTSTERDYRIRVLDLDPGKLKTVMLPDGTLHPVGLGALQDGLLGGVVVILENEEPS
jgi:hypothetical protein